MFSRKSVLHNGLVSAVVYSGIVLFFATGCASSKVDKQTQSSRMDADVWVEKTLQSLTLREKVGQMFFASINGAHHAVDDSELLAAEALVRDAGIGGFHVWRGEPYAMANLSNRLQRLAKVPLLFTADFEHGSGWRFTGGVDFPPQMAIAATGDTAYAFALGRITAEEGRAMGIHLTFAPVVDVNSNPFNPIINTRSFGATPANVSRFANAFIRGAHAGGMLTTAKHFPGHGDTGMDSHLTLATIAADSARLAAVELSPFQSAIAAGVDAIMSAHIHVNGIDMEPYYPATLSSAMIENLLRKKIGFDGLVFTDAMGMYAVRHNFTERFAAVTAVEAGIDVILVSPDLRAGIETVVQAVERGEISRARIDASVRRILRAKAKVGLLQNRFVAPEKLPEKLGRHADEKIAGEAAQKSLTLLKNQDNLLPLQPAGYDGHVALVVVSDVPPANPVEVLTGRLQASFSHLTVDILDGETRPACFVVAKENVKNASLVIMPMIATFGAYKGAISLSDTVAMAVRELLSIGKPVLAVAMGSPYLIQQFPDVSAYLCAYGNTPQLQNAVANAIFGMAPITGKLPVPIPGLFAIDAGLEIRAITARPPMPSPAMPAPRLRVGMLEEAGFSRAGLARVDSLMTAAVRDSVFPGAVLLVARNATIVLHKAYGQMGYGEFARPTPVDAIYDLASLTKVVATTTATMLLVEQGKIDLSAPVQQYLPEFIGPEKDQITVRHLLVHASGLPAFKRYFLENLLPGEIITRILQEPLEYTPGEKEIYSDLGMILMSKIIEQVTGLSFAQYCQQNIFSPLGMTETFFNPPERIWDRIPPTEQDPWRGRMAHGVVHDENSFALGGAVGHAGLFSSVRDLAVLVQMLLDGGAYDTTRVLSPWVIAEFTRKQGLVPGSDRALGWDTRSAESSSGHFMSPQAFGHTGFTGTSIWVDPQKNLFVILLSNRVHPTRANRKILGFRPRLHDAVMQALQVE